MWRKLPPSVFWWSLHLTANLLQDASLQDVPGEGLEGMGPAGSRAKSKATLDELLDTLKLLEQEPEPLPCPRAYHKDKYAWTDEVTTGPGTAHPDPRGALGAREVHQAPLCSSKTLMRARWHLIESPQLSQGSLRVRTLRIT